MNRNSPLLFDTVDSLALAGCAGAMLVSVLLGTFHWVLHPLCRERAMGPLVGTLMTLTAVFPGVATVFAGLWSEWLMCAACLCLPLVLSASTRSTTSRIRSVLPLPTIKLFVLSATLTSVVSIAVVGVLLVVGPHSTLVASDTSSTPRHYSTPRGFSTVEVISTKSLVVTYYSYVTLYGRPTSPPTVGGLHLLGGEYVSADSIHVLPDLHAPVLVIDSCNVTLSNIVVECWSRPCIVSRGCAEETLRQGVTAKINGTVLPLDLEITWTERDISDGSSTGVSGADYISALHIEFEPYWHVLSRQLPVLFNGIRDGLYILASTCRYVWVEVGAPAAHVAWHTVVPTCGSIVSEVAFLIQVGACGSLDGLSNLLLSDVTSPRSTLRDGCIMVCGNVVRSVQLSEQQIAFGDRGVDAQLTIHVDEAPQEELARAVSGGLRVVEVTLYNTLRDVMWLAAHTGVPYVAVYIADCAKADWELFIWHFSNLGPALFEPTVQLVALIYAGLNYLLPSTVQVEGGSDQIAEWLHTVGSLGWVGLWAGTLYTIDLLSSGMSTILMLMGQLLLWSWDVSMGASGGALTGASSMFGGLFGAVTWLTEMLYMLVMWTILAVINTCRYGVSLYSGCSLYTHLFVCALQTGVIVLALLREIKGREENLQWYQYTYRIITMYYQNIRPVVVYSVAHLVGIVLAVGTSFLPLSGTTGLHFLVVQIVLPAASTYGFVYFMRDETVAQGVLVDGDDAAPRTPEERDRHELSKWRQDRARELAVRKKTAIWFGARAVCTIIIQKCVGDIVAVIVGELLMVAVIFGAVVVGVLSVKARGGIRAVQPEGAVAQQ